MKTAILFISLFLLTFKIGHSQTNIYHPFPDSNAVWNINFSRYCFNLCPPLDDNYSINISGDTLINSETYHKLTTPYIQVVSSCLAPCLSSTKTGYKGAIRQDTANRKVFFVPPSDTTEQLLYDFTMQVGDTVKGYIEAIANPAADTVYSIDSVLVGNKYHKRWNISSMYGISFIEGVGSNYGLIEQSPGNITDQADYSIICFKQNNITLYPSTATNCSLITRDSVNSIEENLNQITFYPNPSDGKFMIKHEDISIERYEVEVYNVLGEKIYSKSDQPSFIDISSQPNGIYYLYVKTEIGYSPKNIFSTPQKLIITH